MASVAFPSSGSWDEKVKTTLTEWAPSYSHELTATDATEILCNASGFISLLADWADKQGLNHTKEKHL